MAIDRDRLRLPDSRIIINLLFAFSLARKGSADPTCFTLFVKTRD